MPVQSPDHRFRLGAEGAGIGGWDIDLATNTLYWSRTTRRLFGVSDDTAVSFELFLSLLEPDDREHTKAAISRAIAHGSPLDLSYRLKRGDGSHHWVRARGSVTETINGTHLPGDIFGLESGPNHRLATEAIIDTTVRLLKRRNLEQAASTNVHVAHKLWTMTATDLQRAEVHMLLLGRKNAMERVANFLLEMDRRLAGAGMMALPMCRRDIGDYLGLTLETVSRALSQLNNEGVLNFSGARQIVLRNRQRLHNMDA